MIVGRVIVWWMIMGSIEACLWGRYYIENLETTGLKDN